VANSTAGPKVSRLIDFYRGKSTDDHGRTIREILEWDDLRLEYTHDYIQWLFPLQTRSAFNLSAPTLTSGDIDAFHSDESLRKAMLYALERMFKFYGLALEREENKAVVRKAPNWAERSGNWLSPSNHNHLRITRILTSLRILGLREYAEAFYGALSSIYNSETRGVITAESFRFWSQTLDK
jgi:hypothetical protein